MTSIPPTPAVLKLGYRNPGHLLFSYCAHLSKGRLWVRSPRPLAVGTPVKLEIVVPGQRWTERLHATVSCSRSRTDGYGPPGMGLCLENHEPMLGELIDRMVPLSSPCRVDLVGANAYSTRHLAAMTQTFMECRVEHRELRDDVLLRCAGADLVVVDLEIDETLGLDLLRTLADQPNAPTLVVLMQDLTTPQAQEAAGLAHVAQLPLERNEFRRAMIRALAQTCWLGAHRVVNIHDTMPTAALHGPPPKQKPTRLRTASPQTEVPKLRPSAESNWSVHTSWRKPPTRAKTKGALVSDEIYDASPSDPLTTSSEDMDKALEQAGLAISQEELQAPAANEGPSEDAPTHASGKGVEDTLEPGVVDQDVGPEDANAAGLCFAQTAPTNCAPAKKEACGQGDSEPSAASTAANPRLAPCASPKEASALCKTLEGVSPEPSPEELRKTA